MKHIGQYIGYGFAVVMIMILSVPVIAEEPYVLSVQQLKAGLDRASDPSQKGFILVDVRTPEEHANGYIPGTDLNIDYRELKERTTELGARRDDHIVLYCQSGHRSTIASNILADLGYQFVYNVASSMNAWEAAGYPLSFPRH